MKELNIKMPELVGTEKQVAWANDIRENFFSVLDGMVQTAERFETENKIEYWVMYGARTVYVTSSELEEIREKLYKNCAGITSAKKMIDCRDHLTRDFIEKVVAVELVKKGK